MRIGVEVVVIIGVCCSGSATNVTVTTYIPLFQSRLHVGKHSRDINGTSIIIISIPLVDGAFGQDVSGDSMWNVGRK